MITTINLVSIHHLLVCRRQIQSDWTWRQFPQRFRCSESSSRLNPQLKTKPDNQLSQESRVSLPSSQRRYFQICTTTSTKIVINIEIDLLLKERVIRKSQILTERIWVWVAGPSVWPLDSPMSQEKGQGSAALRDHSCGPWLLPGVL